MDHLIVEAAGRRWACATRQVVEVVPAAPATRLPGAPSHVRGLVNLRGTVLTVVDLAARLAAEGALDAAATSAREDSVIVVARAGTRRLGIAVDDVDDVCALTVHERRGFRARGETDALVPIVRAAARMGDPKGGAVVGVIDVEALVRETLGLDLDTQREQQS